MAACFLTPSANLDVMFDAEVILYSAIFLSTITNHRQFFNDFYASCPSVGFEIDGVSAGGAIYDGEHFHIAVLPAFYGRWGRLWQPTLAWLFSIADPVDARIAKDNLRCLRFAERSGFPRIAEDDVVITYRMSSQLHQKKIKIAA